MALYRRHTSQHVCEAQAVGVGRAKRLLCYDKLLQRQWPPSVMDGIIRVVIVDDIAETRANIARLLEFDGGINVVGEASDGHEALEICRRKTPDCVLMDVNMGGLDGIAATKALRAEMPRTIVIMMSVQDDQEYRRRAYMVGAQSYLVKPFGVDELTDTVRQAYRAEVSV